MKRELTYEDVTLFSREISSITSRFSEEITLQRPVRIGDTALSVGLLMSAPMFDVTGEKMSDFLYENGQVPVLHRFQAPGEQFAALGRLAQRHPTRLLSFAIGINDAAERLQAFQDMVETLGLADLNFLVCIDTANGANELLESVIRRIQRTHATVYEKRHIRLEIMAGNIVTQEAAAYLYSLGVRFLRVGISGGSVCSTSEVTGIFRPMISTLLEIAEFRERANLEDLYLVADGGIKTSADALKALAVGADFVMLGSLLAGYHESNAPLIDAKGECVSDELAVLLQELDYSHHHKQYRGMASAEMAALNHSLSGVEKPILPEGVERTVVYRGRAITFLTTLLHSFRSSFSYCNARNLAEFQQNAEVVEVTHNSSHVRKPHFPIKTSNKSE